VLLRYGSSCFLQLLDEETAPTENRLDQIRSERIARAAHKKSQFQLSLAHLTEATNHDYNYFNSSSTVPVTHNKNDSAPAPQHLLRNLYEKHVCIGPNETVELEIETRTQNLSNAWHEERKLRITASIMKDVCHRKPKTDVTSFVNRKLAPNSIKSPGIEYGRSNGHLAIKSYVDYQRKRFLSRYTNVACMLIHPYHG